MTQNKEQNGSIVQKMVLTDVKTSKLTVDGGVGKFTLTFKVDHIRKYGGVMLDDICLALNKISTITIETIQQEMPFADPDQEELDLSAYSEAQRTVIQIWGMEMVVLEDHELYFDCNNCEYTGRPLHLIDGIVSYCPNCDPEVTARSEAEQEETFILADDPLGSFYPYRTESEQAEFNEKVESELVTIDDDGNITESLPQDGGGGE